MGIVNGNSRFRSRAFDAVMPQPVVEGRVRPSEERVFRIIPGQHLENRPSARLQPRRVRRNLHAFGKLRMARCHGPFAPGDLNQTKLAVSARLHTRVVTQRRHANPELVQRIEDSQTGAELRGLTIDCDAQTMSPPIGWWNRTPPMTKY